MKQNREMWGVLGMWCIITNSNWALQLVMRCQGWGKGGLSGRPSGRGSPTAPWQCSGFPSCKINCNSPALHHCLFQADLIFSLAHFMYPKLSLFVAFLWLQTRPYQSRLSTHQAPRPTLDLAHVQWWAETWGRRVAQERQLEVTVSGALLTLGFGNVLKCQ